VVRAALWNPMLQAEMCSCIYTRSDVRGQLFGPSRMTTQIVVLFLNSQNCAILQSHYYFEKG
jgi:hypothetical protein